MKIVSWNIMQGGGPRAADIFNQLAEWNADVVCLQEFCDTANSALIAERLCSIGLAQQVFAQTSQMYRVFVASRIPFEVVETNEMFPELGRSVVVKLQCKTPLLMAAVHIPNRDEPPKVKFEFHEKVIRFMEKYASEDAIVIGDTNSGQIGFDEESSYFNDKEHGWFDLIAKAGWADSWRKRNPESREYTWRSNSGNGFRLDQAFASKSADGRIRKIEYVQPKTIEKTGKRISDHAAIVLEIADA